MQICMHPACSMYLRILSHGLSVCVGSDSCNTAHDPFTSFEQGSGGLCCMAARAQCHHTRGRGKCAAITISADISLCCHSTLDPQFMHASVHSVADPAPVTRNRSSNAKSASTASTSTHWQRHRIPSSNSWTTQIRTERSAHVNATAALTSALPPVIEACALTF